MATNRFHLESGSMFSESAESRKAIGDVDVVYHDGLYHLFHLVLPNHDFIAHAISTDALNWRRVNNAIFIGDPGSWDDLMLWTMHVTPDPFQKGQWRMFYTGLSRRDQGNFQRLGLATSPDLFHWTKASTNWHDRRGKADPDPVRKAMQKSASREADERHSVRDETSCFPLEPDPRFYESSLNEGRNWVSFRDPFYYYDGKDGWLLAAGRVKDGPVVRRGCVAVFKESEHNCFEAVPALHHPRLYDDIEVPNLLKLEDDYYLIGSIREDAKIRYWHTQDINKPWASYHDNVLLAQGNYAGRICKDDQGWLLWNFYSLDSDDRTANNILPPPKRLGRNKDGLLRATSFEAFNGLIGKQLDTRCVHQLKEGTRDEVCGIQEGSLDLSSEFGFQAFVFDEQTSDFRMRAQLKLQGKGKCGIVFRIDPETHDGYYLSLDLLKGIAQLRAWGTGPAGSGEHMMRFQSLQAGYWFSETPGEAKVQLIAYGSYVEFSVDDRVVLTLADRLFEQGNLGIYLETAHLSVEQLEVVELRSPFQTDDHLVKG